MRLERTVRLTYPTNLQGQPLLYRLIQQFGLQTNILEARVCPEEAWLVLAVSGEFERVYLGLAWMAEQGVQVESLAEVWLEEEA